MSPCSQAPSRPRSWRSSCRAPSSSAGGVSPGWRAAAGSASKVSGSADRGRPQSMSIGVAAETRPSQTGVAATPETVKKRAAKNEVRVQAGAGVAASIRDQDYEAAGAKIVASAAEAYDADIVLKVRAPTESETGLLKEK